MSVLTYDIAKREFRYHGATNPTVARVLENASTMGSIPELLWASVKYAYDRTKDQDIRAALVQFNESLEFPAVPNGDMPAPRRIEVINKVSPGGTVLYGYQLKAVQALEYGSCMLGDEMGLGKTLSALMAWEHLVGGQTWLKVTGPEKVRKLTVVCPSDEVADEWAIALEKHMNLNVYVRHVKTRADIDAASRAAVVLIPYSRVWRDGYAEMVQRRCTDRDILVLDEAHRASRTESKQHMFLWNLVYGKKLRVWCLSGTEVSNTPESYFAMYRLITRSRMPKLTWMEHCYDPFANYWKKEKLKEIRVLRKGFALRRTCTEVGQQLPECTEVTCKVGMDAVTAVLYQAMKTESSMQVQLAVDQKKTITEGLYMVVFGRLMQLASHPLLLGETRVDETPKYHRCCELVEEAGGQKVIIWSNYPGTIDWLHDKLTKAYPGLTIAKAHGKTKKPDRQQVKEDFQAYKVDVLIANPAIWSEGINLQAGNVMIYWDFHASRVRWEQSKKRSHRTGQKMPVFIYKLVVRGSVEEKTLAWLEKKAELARLITGS